MESRPTFLVTQRDKIMKNIVWLTLILLALPQLALGARVDETVDAAPNGEVEISVIAGKISPNVKARIRKRV